MYVRAGDERIECTRAERTGNSIKLYTDGSLIAAFDGISDFGGYTIEGGEWSAPPKSEVEILREAVEALIAARLEG